MLDRQVLRKGQHSSISLTHKKEYVYMYLAIYKVNETNVTNKLSTSILPENVTKTHFNNHYFANVISAARCGLNILLQIKCTPKPATLFFPFPKNT